MINGAAPNNNAPTYLFQTDGNGSLGGGNIPGDSSGCYKYMRVEFAGHEFTIDNELNGITLNSVGNGTTFEYIQINQNADDGIEWFGGRCDVRYAVVSGQDDDGFDTDLVSQFRGQFLIVLQDTTKSTSANHEEFERDDHSAGFEYLPRNMPMIYNATLCGQGHNFATVPNIGVHVRRGAAGQIFNSVWTRFRRAIDHDNDPPALRLLNADSVFIRCPSRATWVPGGSCPFGGPCPLKATLRISSVKSPSY